MMRHLGFIQWLFLTCVFGSGCNIVLCTSQRRLPIDHDYQGDVYEYDYDDDIGKLEGNEINMSTPTYELPHFEKSKIIISTNPNDDLVLNCDVRNFRIGNVAVWYNDTSIIVNGQIALFSRIDVMKNNSIRIKNIQEEDAGDYYCEILPEKIRTHILVNVGQRLVILCDARDVTNRVLTFRQGESHTIECKSYLPSRADIKWFLNGQRIRHVVTGIDESKMYIDNIDAEHAGIYQCLADDGSNKPPHGSLTIDVQYAPKVSTHRHHINAAHEKSAELYCNYKANPIAMSRWLRNGQLLSLSEKYVIRNEVHESHNRSVLTVKDVKEIDLGTYNCQIENVIGLNEVKIYLGYEPENPQYEDMAIDGEKVTIQWLVRSIQPLSEAILDYKLNGSYTWSSVSVLSTQRHSEDNEIWKITHKIKLSPGDWHVRLRTKNTEGWSKFSAQHDFHIKDNDAIIVEEVELPPEDIKYAGIGTDSKNNSAFSSNTPFMILTVNLLTLLFL